MTIKLDTQKKYKVVHYIKNKFGTWYLIKKSSGEWWVHQSRVTNILKQ